MKRIKIIVAAIVRGALLISPGVAFAIWQWGKVSAIVNILAAVGLETVFLMVFAFFAVVIHTARDDARKRASGSTENIEVEITE